MAERHPLRCRGARGAGLAGLLDFDTGDAAAAAGNGVWEDGEGRNTCKSADRCAGGGLRRRRLRASRRAIATPTPHCWYVGAAAGAARVRVAPSSVLAVAALVIVRVRAGRGVANPAPFRHGLLLRELEDDACDRRLFHVIPLTFLVHCG